MNGIKHPYRAGVSAAALRTNICPCPATKVDLCPHAVMTWRNHRAMCHYAHAVPTALGVESTCCSPNRILGHWVDGASKASERLSWWLTGYQSPTAPRETSWGSTPQRGGAEHSANQNAAEDDPHVADHLPAHLA